MKNRIIAYGRRYAYRGRRRPAAPGRSTLQLLNARNDVQAVSGVLALLAAIVSVGSFSLLIRSF